MAELRWRDHRLTAAAGLVDGVAGVVEQVARGDYRKANRLAAWRAVVAAQAESAVTPDEHGRPNTAAASFVAKAINAWANSRDRGNDATAGMGGITLHIDAAAAVEIIERLRARGVTAESE